MCKDLKVDGLKVYEEIARPDSVTSGSRFYVFPDGTYLFSFIERNGKTFSMDRRYKMALIEQRLKKCSGKTRCE